MGDPEVPGTVLSGLLHGIRFTARRSLPGQRAPATLLSRNKSTFACSRRCDPPNLAQAGNTLCPGARCSSASVSGAIVRRRTDRHASAQCTCLRNTAPWSRRCSAYPRNGCGCPTSTVSQPEASPELGLLVAAPPGAQLNHEFWTRPWAARYLAHVGLSAPPMSDHSTVCAMWPASSGPSGTSPSEASPNAWFPLQAGLSVDSAYKKPPPGPMETDRNLTPEVGHDCSTSRSAVKRETEGRVKFSFGATPFLCLQ